MSNKTTYTASDVVQVDKETAEFIKDAENWAKSASEEAETIRAAKTNQSLFHMGVLTFLNSEPPNADLMENSDAYFHGYDYGRRLTVQIKEVAAKRFPTNLGNSKVGDYANVLLKKNIEVNDLTTDIDNVEWRSIDER